MQSTNSSSSLQKSYYRWAHLTHDRKWLNSSPPSTYSMTRYNFVSSRKYPNLEHKNQSWLFRAIFTAQYITLFDRSTNDHVWQNAIDRSFIGKIVRYNLLARSQRTVDTWRRPGPFPELPACMFPRKCGWKYGTSTTQAQQDGTIESYISSIHLYLPSPEAAHRSFRAPEVRRHGDISLRLI